MNDKDRVVKHLEIIQGVVNRLGHDSFLVKGWSMAILTASLVLVSKDTLGNGCFILIFLIPILGFWTLDGYFLWQERLFREVYNDVRTQDATDFAMNIAKHRNKPNRNYLSSLFSRTILLFYAIEIVFIASAYAAIKTT